MRYTVSEGGNAASRVVRHLAIALSYLVTVLPGNPVHAMQFRGVPAGSAEAVIFGSGPIVAGDLDRLVQALDDVARGGQRLDALALDSPGGSVAEARRMVTVIRGRHIPVVLNHNTTCASACFLLLAASPRRLAATDALVGVHSASIDGAETDTSLAVTTLMAREAHDLGVPPGIVGKMVETTPGRVEWLTPGDLASMNVTLFTGDLASAVRFPPGSARSVLPAGAPGHGAIPLPAEAAAGAASGRSDRRAFDEWLASLRDASQAGAGVALARFPDIRPIDCYGPNGVNRGDFTLGCTAAQQRLARAARGFRADPDYAKGWGSSPAPLAAPGGTAEQEYSGAYWCASQLGKLTIKVFAEASETHRRALIDFGPHPSGQNIPRGSFMAEGPIDSQAGTMTLSPAKWVSQPTNGAWFGIVGESDDGGKTFSGRVTDNPTCTRFTLARRPASAAGR